MAAAPKRRAASAGEVFKALPPKPPEPAPEPEGDPEKLVDVTYEGPHRVHFTRLGLVFEHGDTHRMSERDAIDLQQRAIGHAWDVRELGPEGEDQQQDRG